MSTLYFDLMDMYVQDSDWSHLAGCDSIRECLPEEDDYDEESNAEIDFTWGDLLY